MTGRSRSQRLLTVGWLTPKNAPATSWVRFLRISATTSATDRNSPIEAGRPPGRVTSPMMAAARAVSSVSCPPVSPVIASYRNGSSWISRLCGSTGFHGQAFVFSARHAGEPYSKRDARGSRSSLLGGG